MNLTKGFFYDKRAMEKLLSFVIYLILVAIIFLGLLRFIDNSLSDISIKEQTLAKQIALFIDVAKPGTQIVITKGNFIVSLKNNEVNVKSKQERQGYTYNFFTQNKIETEDKGGVLIIAIS